MKRRLILALFGLPLLSVLTHAQDPDVPLIDDLSPDRKASADPDASLIDDLSPARKVSAETPQGPPRSPKESAKGAAANDKPGIPGDSDRPAEPILGEMPKDLSAAVSRALQRNPQVLIADAKVRQAQAELNEVKFKVVGKVTAAYREYAHYKQTLVDIPKDFKGPNDALRRQIQSQIEGSELDLIYLLGIGADSALPSPEQGGISVDEHNSDGRSQTKSANKAAAGRKIEEASIPALKKQRAARAPVIPKVLRTALASKTVMEFDDQPLQEAVAYLGERHGVQFILSEKQITVPVTCNVHDITLAAALQAIADLTRYCFVFRDYGILVVEEGHAIDYRRNHVPMIAPGEHSPPLDDQDGESKSPYGARY